MERQTRGLQFCDGLNASCRGAPGNSRQKVHGAAAQAEEVETAILAGPDDRIDPGQRVSRLFQKLCREAGAVSPDRNGIRMIAKCPLENVRKARAQIALPLNPNLHRTGNAIVETFFGGGEHCLGPRQSGNRGAGVLEKSCGEFRRAAAAQSRDEPRLHPASDGGFCEYADAALLRHAISCSESTCSEYGASTV